jgi:HSP20 family protein
MLSRYNVMNPLMPEWGVPTSSGNNFQTLMNRLFQDFDIPFELPQVQRSSAPRAQLRDTGDALRLVVDLPGYRQEDIDLSLEQNVLTLKAKGEVAPKAPEGFTAIRRERTRPPVVWSFELPYAVDIGAIAATLSLGRLQVNLPKAQKAKPRSIPVKTA